MRHKKRQRITKLFIIKNGVMHSDTDILEIEVAEYDACELAETLRANSEYINIADNRQYNPITDTYDTYEDRRFSYKLKGLGRMRLRDMDETDFSQD